MANTNKNKKNIFDLFKRKESETGYTKEQAMKDEPRNFANFFKLAGRNLNNIFLINLLCIIGNFPALFALFAYSGLLNDVSTAPASAMFANLLGTMKMGGIDTLAGASLFGVHGTQTPISVPTVWTYVFYAIGLLTIFTFGIVSVGTTYLARNIVKGEHIFIWNDFWYAVKKNLKQGMIMGAIDLIFICLLGYDFIFFYYNIGISFATDVMFYGIIALIFIYSIMRCYIYITIITFNLSIFKVLKNALIFTFLGLKRNLLGLSGTALVIFINYAFFVTFVPVGIILPMFITFGLCTFIGAYTAFPKIKEYMIDPYYDENGNPKEVKSEE